MPPRGKPRPGPQANTPDIRALGALADLLAESAAAPLAAAREEIADDVRKKITKCIELSAEIALLLGREQADALMAVLMTLAERDTDFDPEQVLDDLIEKCKRLEAEVASYTSTGSAGASSSAGAAQGTVNTSSSDKVRNEGDESPEAKIAELQRELAAVRAELDKTKASLAEVEGRVSNAENAHAHIVALREALLEKLQGVAGDISAAVESVRSVQGNVLIANFAFTEIRRVHDEALTIFKELRPDVLGSLALFDIVVRKFAEVSKAVEASQEIPSLELFCQVVACFARLSDLKILQNELQGAESTVEVPPEWMEGGNMKDYYTILGVHPTDDHKTIQSEYRRKIRTVHQDATGKDSPISRLYNEAWAVLGDQAKRARYDALHVRIYSAA